MKTSYVQLEDNFPHCHKVQTLAGMVECGEHPTNCKWFISYGSAGFCIHPEAMQLVSTQHKPQ